MGAAQKHFNVTAAKKVLFPYPPLKVQKSIVMNLDSTSEETNRLEVVYRRKLATLTELKQSLLHQAFTGQLTANIKAIDHRLAEAGL